MKSIYLLAALFAFSNAEAKSLDVRGLIKKLNQKTESLQKASEILKVSIVPEAPRVGDSPSIFIQPVTGFGDYEAVVEASLNANPVTLEMPATELWIFDTGPLAEIREHQFLVKLYVQPKVDAQQIRDAIVVLTQQIEALNEQIDQTTDPVEKSALEAERDQKQAQLDELILALANLKRFVGETNFSFRVEAKENIEGHPYISDVNPNFGAKQGGSEISISGTNLEGVNQVKIGGQVASITSATTSLVSVIAPNFVSEGAKDVELRVETLNGVKNAILKNGYFATEKPLLPNIKPVAVATTEDSTVNLGSLANLDASNSYDQNSQTLRYEWRVVSKPTKSQQSFPNPAGEGVAFSFTPDAPGFYVLELKAIETTAPFLESNPSLLVIEGIAPANRAPQYQSTSLSVPAGGIASVQVQASDADFWQTKAFFLSSQGTLGAASISPTGVLEYQAGSNTGSDSVQVLIVDNGDPQLSTTGTVNITVGAPNQLPVFGEPIFRKHIARNPARVALDAVFFDPDGTIQEVSWNFGDGTSQKSPDLFSGYIEHDYVNPGTYSVTVTIKDNQGGTTTRTDSIAVVNTDIPQTSAKADVLSGAVPLTVNFTATAQDSDGIATVRWRWGDGSPEERGGLDYLNRSHTFNTTGVYEVRFRVRDTNLAETNHLIKIYAGVSPPTEGISPLPFFEATPREQLINQPVNFNGELSFDPFQSAGAISYCWNFLFGGNCESSLAQPSYTYSSAQNYFPSLIVTGSGGAVSDTFVREVQAVNAGKAPKAVPNQYELSGVAPFNISIDGLDSYDYDGSISEYKWTYENPGCPGGFCEQSGAVGNFTFTEPGIYFPILGVKDNDNNWNYSTPLVEVLAAPAKAKKSKYRAFEGGEGDAGEREKKRRLLTNACAKGQGSSCLALSKMYTEDGDAFTAQKLKERACTLGHQPACEWR